MPLIPIEIPPGVVKTDSPNAAKGRYINSDKFRFIGKFPEKWLGWSRFLPVAQGDMRGVARGATSWANTLGTQNVAIGTHLKLYTITGGDTLTDITPLRISGTLANNPFATTISSTTVTVTHTSHGLAQEAFVTFSGAAAGAGITVNGEYQVVSVVDANSYTITHSAAATSTSAGMGGAAVAYAYQINPGNQNPSFGTGYGIGTWGGGGWGSPHTTGLPIDMRHWSVHPYGNNLVAVPFGDTLYDWEETVDTRAQIVTNAPSYIRSMFVTSERFVFALGTNNGVSLNPMRIQWPDQNDITAWTPTNANTANSLVLQNGSKLIAGCALQDLISLVWSDTALYVFQYTGDSSVYSPRLAGDNCGLAGPLAFTNIGGVAYWMSGHDFHFYSGAVQQIPNSQDIRDFVFGDMETDLLQKSYCIYNQKNGTIIWGYVSNDSTDTEPDKYVEVSLDTYSWAVGTLRRTCAVMYRPQDSSVLMVNGSGRVFLHETGVNDDGAAMSAFIQFGEYAISQGEENVDVVGFVPDFERHEENVSVLLYTKDRPNSASHFDEQTLTVAEGDLIGDARISGRYFGFKITTNAIGGDLRLGIPQIELGPGTAGERR